MPIRKRQQLLFLLLLMLACSVLEVVSIGAVLPFLAAITNPEKVMVAPLIMPVMEWLNVKTAEQLQVLLTTSFIVASLTAGAARVFLIWCNTKIAYAIGEFLSLQIYWKTLCQPYAVHLNRNSSVIIASIVN